MNFPYLHLYLCLDLHLYPSFPAEFLAHRRQTQPSCLAHQDCCQFSKATASPPRLTSVLQSHISSCSPSLVGAQLYLFRGKTLHSASKAASLQLQGSCVTRLFMCISPFHCFSDTRLELQVFGMPGSLRYISSVTISPVKHEITLIFLGHFPLAV